MSNQFLVVSLLGNDSIPLGQDVNVLDVPVGGSGNKPAPGVRLQLHPMDQDGTHPNQLWTFEESAEHPGYFFILSQQKGNGSQALALDIEGDVQPPIGGARIDAYTQKSNSPTAPKNTKNQLWTLRAGPPIGPPNGYGVAETNGFFIQSILQDDNKGDMVLDVKGGTDNQVPASGAVIQLYGKKSSGNQNQLWTLLPAPGDTFAAKNTEITELSASGALLSPPVNPSITIAGKGFFPGSQLILNLQLIPPESMPETPNFQTISIGNADFAGNFQVTLPSSVLYIDHPGKLTAQVQCTYYLVGSSTSTLSATKSASWNGLKLI